MATSNVEMKPSQIEPAHRIFGARATYLHPGKKETDQYDDSGACVNATQESQLFSGSFAYTYAPSTFGSGSLWAIIRKIWSLK